MSRELSEWQIKLRLSNVIGTMEIEGFTFSEEEKEILRRFICKEITFDEAFKLLQGEKK